MFSGNLSFPNKINAITAIKSISLPLNPNTINPQLK
jgi:hypothetical protein